MKKIKITKKRTLNELRQVKNYGYVTPSPSKEKDLKNKLPKWFDGETYDDGGVVTNRFSGEEYQLTAEELSMYDFIMGATMMTEMNIKYDTQMIADLRKGLEWFKENNSKAYMVLLD